MTIDLSVFMDHELQRETDIVKLNKLIEHLKGLVNHRATLESYIRFYEEFEPKPTNNLVALDHEYRLRYISEKARTILGYKSEEEARRIIGTHYKDLISDANNKNLFENAIIKREKVHLVGLLYSMPGKPVYVRSRIMHYITTNKDFVIGVALRIKKA